MNEARILLVEDDEELARLTRDYLQNHGLRVAIEANGEVAVTRIIQEQPDLVILDIMLPGKDGFAVCREVRPAWAGPLLMLTARDEDMDQLLGLELGADDYVTKPVQPRLLLARIHALLRRGCRNKLARPAARENVLQFDGLVLDAGRREVSRDGVNVDLTTAEFNLLWLLAQYRGEVLSRNEILQKLRGIEYDGADRSIDLRISRLRKKLGNAALIKTVHGQGYQFTGVCA